MLKVGLMMRWTLKERWIVDEVVGGGVGVADVVSMSHHYTNKCYF